MANTLTKAGITTGNTVEAFHVTQSIDAFSGTEAYDISLSGSFNMTGPTDINGDTTITGSLNVSETVYIGNTAQPTTSASLYIRQPSASSGTESPIIDIQVEDANSYFRLNNNTNTDGVFSPAIITRQADTSDRIALFIDTIIDPTYDIPGAPDVLRFRARQDSGLIQNRDLYAWYNYTTRLMDMDKDGNLNIVASVTASSYTGSFVGDGSGLTGIVSSSYALTASYALNGGGGSTTPGGADTQIQFNDGGTFGGNSNFLLINASSSVIIGSTNTITNFISFAAGVNHNVTGQGSAAFGNNNDVTSNYSFAVGQGNLASGLNSHAEGVQNIASGVGSHAEGNQTTSSGDYAHSQGGSTKALGDYSLACGIASTAFKDYSVALNNSQASGSYQTTVGRYNVQSDNDFLSSGDIFIVGNGILSVPSNAFRVSGSGECFSGTTFTNGGADYAEYFESHDGQAIPLGTVVELTGSYIKACETADNAIGVISNKPSVLGNAEEGTADQWIGMYLKDEWGNYSYESYTFEDPIKVDENGDPITQIGTRKVLNPDYDPSLPYTPRSSRPEWNVVGLLGQIRVLKNQNIPSRWIKMKDINDDIAIYLVK